MAVEAVTLKPDAIVLWSNTMAKAAQAATKTLPVVFVAVADPVGTGIVESLARPGRNVTGLTHIALDLIPKRLELMRELMPGVRHIGVLVSTANPISRQAVEEVERATAQLRMTVAVHRISDPSQIEPAIGHIARVPHSALVVPPETFLWVLRQQVVSAAMSHRLPSVFEQREFVEPGGLLSYGPSLHDLTRRAGEYVARILSGARPADLPVEQPIKFELVINLKTAKALGLTIPPSLLLRADQVIE